jgi:hypothetical protein
MLPHSPVTGEIDLREDGSGPTKVGPYNERCGDDEDP